MTPSSAMGIIFPNMHDDNIPELVGHRTMASVPFAGRYRMIDFCLSGMASAGMRDIGVIVTQNYQSLMDHLGSGREWDLSSKRGGLVIFPPFGRDSSNTFDGRIEMLASVLDYLQSRTENLLVMSDCDIACNVDYRALINHHLKSGADLTAVYEKGAIEDGMRKDNYTYNISNEGFITDIRINDYRKGTQNLAMNVYVVGRELMISIVHEAMVRGEHHFVRDILSRNLKVYKVSAYEYTGYCARIFDMRSYYHESLRLLEKGNVEKLFPEENPIYTKVRDEAPVRYAIGSKVTKCLVADGCIIEGEAENCLLFRGVRVGKGAKLKNCVIMQGNEIGPGAVLENVVTDKNVVVGAGQSLHGATSFPVFVGKNSNVGGATARLAGAEE